MNLGPCSSVGNVLLGNWDSFFWRKGKAGHAVDCFSVLFLMAASWISFLTQLSLLGWVISEVEQ